MAQQASGGTYLLTKDLPSTPGSSNMTGGIYSLAFTFGEQFATPGITDGTHLVLPGYFGGPYGNGQTFTVASSQVGTTSTYQDGIQIGVPLGASIVIDFSDQLMSQTIASGIEVKVITDHLGHNLDQPTTFSWTYPTSSQRLVIQPVGSWSGNTLYDVVLTPTLLSLGGFTLNQVFHIQFVTVLDPHEDNVVIHHVATNSSSSGSVLPSPDLDVQVPKDAFSDFVVVRFSNSPLSSPLHVDPNLVSAANAKASASNGYQVPLAYREAVAFDMAGKPVTTLGKAANLSVNYQPSGNSTPSKIRSTTLSLFALDETHQLWVKIPQSRAADGSSYSAGVNRLGLFAVMGNADNSAADSFVFPNPFRPHGPNAGLASGQTGTDAGGVTFSNLPSECTISIYTLSGERVRTLRHSDGVGPIAQEPWDVRTAHGDRVASGVYLWRVESATDSKNGKLMVIQ